MWKIERRVKEESAKGKTWFYEKEDSFKLWWKKHTENPVYKCYSFRGYKLTSVDPDIWTLVRPRRLREQNG